MNWLKYDYTTTINLPLHIPRGLILIIVIIVGYSLIPGYMNYFSGKLLRIPTLCIIYTIIFIELLLYFIIRIFILLLETLIAKPYHRKLRNNLSKCQSYNEWYDIASQLDISQNRQKWQTTLNDFTAYHYGWEFIDELILDMRKARSQNDIQMALAILQQCTRKNVGGIMREELYSYTNTGEPKLIVNNFINEVCLTIDYVTNYVINTDSNNNVNDNIENNIELLRNNVYDFLICARKAYGKTALCMSGGGMMALYHLGSVRAMLDENILPHIISGASAGALIAALICCRTEDELHNDLSPEKLQPIFTCCSKNWIERFINYIKYGSMFNNDEWLDLVQWFTCGNMTFIEAYRKSGRVLCITLSTTTKKAPPVVLNYISAPNVVISSAVVASSSMPYILKPMYLQSKDPSTGKIHILKEEYWDGSIEQDIPMSGLAEILNCHFFIVTQANPHIIPFIFKMDGDIGRPNRWGKDTRRGGYLLSGLELYLKMDMKNKLNFLREVGAVTGFTANLFSQEFNGTTTIVPDVQIIDYIRALENPTMTDMKRYFVGGKSCAYRNFVLIKNHYKIAIIMDKCIKKLKEKQKQQQQSTITSSSSTNRIINNNTNMSPFSTRNTSSSSIAAATSSTPQHQKQQQQQQQTPRRSKRLANKNKTNNISKNENQERRYMEEYVNDENEDPQQQEKQQEQEYTNANDNSNDQTTTTTNNIYERYHYHHDATLADGYSETYCTPNSIWKGVTTDL